MVEHAIDRELKGLTIINELEQEYIETEQNQNLDESSLESSKEESIDDEIP